MILFKQAKDLSEYLSTRKQEGKSISFVPTMGALHPGHLSLIAEAKAKADITVCSIFVNPTQFNNPDDFNKYPSTIEQDIERLNGAGCDCLFLPSAAEIYPSDYKAPLYNLGNLEQILEGEFRPGHFQGVCQVVDRLLQIVDPTYLFLGQKDFQQCLVIHRLLEVTGRTNMALIIAPTIRENDGLAMSSRNLRLTPAQRSVAPELFAALTRAKTENGQKSSEEIKSEAVSELTQKGFRVDYFEVADAHTLMPANGKSTEKVALVAAYLDDIRLIDNLPFN